MAYSTSKSPTTSTADLSERNNKEIPVVKEEETNNAEAFKKVEVEMARSRLFHINHIVLHAIAFYASVPPRCGSVAVAGWMCCAAGLPPFRASLTACTVLPLPPPLLLLLLLLLLLVSFPAYSTTMSCVTAVRVPLRSTSWPRARSAATSSELTFRAAAGSAVSPRQCWSSANAVWGTSWWCQRGAFTASSGAIPFAMTFRST